MTFNKKEKYATEGVPVMPVARLISRGTELLFPGMLIRFPTEVARPG